VPAAEGEDRSNLQRIDTAPGAGEATGPRAPSRRAGRGRDEVPLGNHVVPAGTRMRETVSLFGSTLVEGEVVSDAVSIFGRTEIARGGKVGGGAVAVLGRLESRGEIGRDSVSVLGASLIDGRVGGDVVTVLGNLHLGPNAVIERDLVVVGGRLTKDPAAVVRGEQVHIPFVPGRGDIEWLTTWFERCLMLARPLAVGPNLGWAWVVAGAALLFHLFVALVFPRGISACAETLETRPAGSVLAAVLTVVLTPVAFVLLAITIVGALVVPLLGLGLFVAALVGKTVMLAWLGRRITGLAGGGSYAAPVLAVLIGGVIVAGLYTVPVIGFLTFKLLSWLGLGVVVYTVALAMRRERPASSGPSGPEASVPPQVPPGSASGASVPAASSIVASGAVVPAAMAKPPVVHMAPATLAPVAPGSPDAPAAVTPPMPAAGGEAPAPAPAGFSVMTPTLPPLAPPPVPPPPPVAAAVTPPSAATGLAPGPAGAMAITWPRAGFLIRLAALALDAVLVGMILSLLSGLLPRFVPFHHGPGGVLLVLAAYGACLWKLRGTTIGGIVCGLKVVRVDQRELDWATAVVRALGCFLSLMVAGLGFIWVAFDDEKQSWHDKIAGTTVVRVPKGVSLV
jgi:uncharacterized RDD family membrane protein YckC